MGNDLAFAFVDPGLAFGVHGSKYKLAGRNHIPHSSPLKDTLPSLHEARRRFKMAIVARFHFLGLSCDSEHAGSIPLPALPALHVDRR